MDEIGHVASKQLDALLKSKIDIFLNKIKAVGIDEVLENFVTQKFVPSLDSQDDKLFVTINLDDFVTYLGEKFSAKLIDGLGDKKKDKDEKPEEKEEK